MRRYFTLIELLIVIAIIAILAGMLLPALGQARIIALKAPCAGNMKQIAQAQLVYTGDFNSYFLRNGMYTCGAIRNIVRRNGQNQARWTSFYDQPWQSALAELYFKSDAELFFCPADKRPNLGAYYPAGKDAFFASDKGMSYATPGNGWSMYRTPLTASDTNYKTVTQRIADIRKASSVTLFFDTPNEVGNAFAAAGNLWTADSISASWLIFANHRKSYNFVFADGHVENRLRESLLSASARNFLVYTVPWTE